MSKKYLIFPLVVILGFAMFINASQGVANKQQKDRTGSPGSDQNCTECHLSGISFISSAAIVVTENANIVTEYEPLKKYTVSVEIQSSGNVGHGFQVTGLLNDNTFAGLVESVNDGRKTVLNDKWYFENAKNETGGTYSMTWIAPAKGSGNVTFYGSALATNGDGKKSGDDYENIPNLVLPESISTSIGDIMNSVELNVYPNPSSSYITVQSNESYSLITVIDLNGKELIRNKKGGNNQIIDVSNLANGMYMVRVEGASDTKEIKFIKQ